MQELISSFITKLLEVLFKCLRTYYNITVGKFNKNMRQLGAAREIIKKIKKPVDERWYFENGSLNEWKKTFNVIKEKILSLQEDGRNSDKNLIYPLLKMFVKVLKNVNC